MATVQRRVERLEQARPVGGRERGRRFITALHRAYGNDGDESPESMSDAEIAEFEAGFEAALELAYGPETAPQVT